MSMMLSDLLRIFHKKRVKLQDCDLSPAKYDMKAVNDRTYAAMIRMGKTRADVAELFGMDTSIPLALQPTDKVPRPTMENVVRLAAFLGVSVGWILTGKPENEVDVFVISPPCSNSMNSASVGPSAASGAAIIAGANNSTVVVQNIAADDLNDMERELIKALRKLPAREQVAVVSYIFALEQGHKEKKQPPSA